MSGVWIMASKQSIDPNKNQPKEEVSSRQQLDKSKELKNFDQFSSDLIRFSWCMEKKLFVLNI